MKRVTLYTVKTSEVVVADGLKSLQHLQQDFLAPVVNSSEVVQTIETVPIYAVVNDGNTFYVAVSPEIRDIFLCLPTSQEELDEAAEIAQGWKELYLDECRRYNDQWYELLELQAKLRESSSFWNRLRNLFRSPENWK